MSSMVSPSTRLLQQLRISATDSVLYFHPESSATVALGARAAGNGRVVASHRRWPVVSQLRRDLELVGLTEVPVHHAHGLAKWFSTGDVRDNAFDLVVIRLPSERVAFYQLVLDAVQVLKPGGRCVVVGGNEEGVKPAAKVLEGVFGKCAVMGHAGGHRLLMSVRGERVDISALQPLVAPFDDVQSFMEVSHVLRGSPLSVFTRPGVFSWEHLDEATATLVEHMHVPEQADVLDLGCGAGVLGAVAGRLLKQGTVTLVDADSEAIRCATGTMTCSGTAHWRVLASDVTEAVRDERFDLVLCNPPFHVGKTTDLALPVRFIEEAAHVLRPGGTLQLVANRKLPYEWELERVFGNRRTVFDGNRFKVLSATRE
jgi:16S rRNA (guanine1207-N2)-methyltransferase